MLRKKAALTSTCLTIIVVATILSTQFSFAQFNPCRIVNLNVVPPSLVQAGQPFQVTSNLTVSCDPSVLPVIRVDVVDESSSKILSSTSVPYATYTSSYTVSIVNQVTAPQAPGGWPLEVQVYVISQINGQSVASTSQLFQVSVQPYTPLVTEVQTTQSATQSFSNSSALSLQVSPPTTNQSTYGEFSTSSQLSFPTETTPSPSAGFLLPIVIVLVGLAAFGILVFAGRRRGSQTVLATKHCGQCGTQLNANENYCTNCGAKQTNER